MKQDLSSKKFESNRETMSLKVIIVNYLHKIELNPVYQRKVVWSPEQMQLLIESIIYNRAINSISLNRDGVDLEERYICLDGKQRLTAIKNFLQGDYGTKDSKSFKVKLTFESKGGDRKWATYEMLKKWSKEEDKFGHKTEFAKEAISMINRFNDFKIDIVTYSELTLPEQAVLFKVINFSSSLTSEEKSFGEFFCSKVIMEYLEHKFQPMLKIWSGKKHKRNNRGKISSELIKFFSCFYSGTDLNFAPTFTRIPKAAPRDVRKFSEALHDDIFSYIDARKNDTDFWTDNLHTKCEEVEKYFKFKKIDVKVKIYIEIVNLLAEKNIITSTTVEGTTWWIIVYFSIFILEKMNENVITRAQFLNDIDSFKSFFADYKDNYLFGGLNQKDVAGRKRFDEVTKLMYDKAYMSVHRVFLEESFKRNIKDIGTKMKSLTMEQKNLALSYFKDHGCKCAMCNQVVNENDIHYDHLSARSLYSDTIAVVLCSTCNQKKTNNDVGSAANLHIYVTNFPASFQDWCTAKGIKAV